MFHTDDFDIDNQEVKKHLNEIKNYLAEAPIDFTERHVVTNNFRELMVNTGLSSMIVGKNFGGLGASFSDAFKVCNKLAEVNTSQAHIFAFQLTGILVPIFSGTKEQSEKWQKETVSNNLLWGNAMNPRTESITVDEKKRQINGFKRYCTGSFGSDVIPTTIPMKDGIRVLILPTTRTGVSVLDDWNSIGQQQTFTCTVKCEGVQYDNYEVLSPRHSSTDNSKTALRALFIQQFFCEMLLGISIGAIKKAKEFVRNRNAPYLNGIGSEFKKDPMTLKLLGELYSDVWSTSLAVDKSRRQISQLFDSIMTGDDFKRDEASMSVACSKVLASNTALKVSSKIFESIGIVSITNKASFDHFWRDARTLSMHDLVAYKQCTLGEWVVNNEIPRPSYFT